MDGKMFSSSRSATRASGTFTRETSGSRSLERGLHLLSVFRSGASILSNADLAARTKVPRPTVSRLTHSLVDAGFLEYDIENQGYRLTPVFLSLADAYHQNDSASELALPVMRAVGESERVNVGLALPNMLEMVYVASVRESRNGVFRRAVPGSRFPIELTSGGRAYLSTLDPAQRNSILDSLGARNEKCEWDGILQEIQDALRRIQADGYCTAHWQPGMTALGSPIAYSDGRAYSLTISFHTCENLESSIKRYGGILLKMKAEIKKIWRGCSE